MEEYSIDNGNCSSCKDCRNMPVIDYEDLEFSNQVDEIPSCGCMDSIFDEVLKDTDAHACTHYHTCIAPGPELPHTHTCVHMHTKIVAPQSNEDSGYNDDSAESKEQNTRKRGCERGGNREAVRKYRQKKKAYTMSLAEEAVKLRASNQQLMQRLQGQSVLEAEVARLKCLLVDIRGRIEGEIGSFPYQKPVKSGDMFNHINANASFPGSSQNRCSAHCGGQIYCPSDGNPRKGIGLNQGYSSGCELGTRNSYQ